jgi:selenide, water dikinase
LEQFEIDRPSVLDECIDFHGNPLLHIPMVLEIKHSIGQAWSGQGGRRNKQGIAMSQELIRDTAGEHVRLTGMVKAAGCAAKLSPSILDSVLARLPKQVDPNVLVGFETSDDAGVYQLSSDLALVQTVDFFTPIVDDPYTFGQIAATNALSDVYAMGGRPISSLSIVGFPNTGRDVAILEGILRGGQAKMQEAGCTVIGGHSLGDDEIKFGYAVTGLIHPERVLKNVGAQPGDRLILTKPLGTGVIATALKKGAAPKDSVDAAIRSMCTLNRAAMEAALAFELHAVTDVTGFSLLGHAREMAVGSKVSFIIDCGQVEYLSGALDLAQKGFLPGGTQRNRDFIGGCVEFASGVPDDVKDLLFDPQTSGGLLISVAAKHSLQIQESLRARGQSAQNLGWVIEKTHPLIQIRIQED